MTAEPEIAGRAPLAVDVEAGNSFQGEVRRRARHGLFAGPAAPAPAGSDWPTKAISPLIRSVSSAARSSAARDRSTAMRWSRAESSRRRRTKLRPA